jgi:amino acid transporter
MSESQRLGEDQLGTEVLTDGEVENPNRRPRWLVGLLIATTVLIIVAVGAYLMFGRELFQRPFLVVAVVSAWLGALVGVSIGHEPR